MLIELIAVDGNGRTGHGDDRFGRIIWPVNYRHMLTTQDNMPVAGLLEI